MKFKESFYREIVRVFFIFPLMVFDILDVW